ncbi:hypothetical protein [Acaryochloris sp. IP29b_bin.148]|uniref:hypothetical protein n=1 Tax=Acaryochloris sp. IP29b_bin.148 TaxID=2969218 RepID=UPI0026218A72|nr:hypothetical protein [Acaryochloris sp. IP29b_bin.148]
MNSSGLSPEAATAVFKIHLDELRRAMDLGELPVQWNCGYPLLSYTDLLNYQLRKGLKTA